MNEITGKTPLREFLDYVSQRNRMLDESSIHGILHWISVERFGFLMAGQCPEADKDVIMWFAYIHDSMRENDGCCFEHGLRAAELVNEVRGTFLSELDDDQIETLKLACRYHTDKQSTGNITADICLDADRLDLTRVGIVPCPARMISCIGAELAGVLSEVAKSYSHVEDMREKSYGILYDYLHGKTSTRSMDEAIAARHSVRQYKDTPMPEKYVRELCMEIEKINIHRHLHIQLILNEPKAFSGLLAKYCKFSRVVNYIALVGRKSYDLDEKLGYEGERLVLMAQRMGLNTCWVAGTFSKNKAVKVSREEKYVAAIAIGYGENQGVQHKNKPIDEVASLEYTPDWFRKGVECVMLAPSAMNRQSFRFALMANGKVRAIAGRGSFAGLDLGIAKLHFEIGSGMDSSIWEHL